MSLVDRLVRFRELRHALDVVEGNIWSDAGRPASISISCEIVPDHVFQAIADYGDVRGLSLWRCDVRDKQFEMLRNLRGLTSFSLTRSPITGEGLRWLPKRVKWMRLGMNARLTAHGLKQIWRFRRLRRLDLSHCELPADGFQGIEQLANLRDLLLFETIVGDEAMEHVAKLPKLQCLTLDDSSISDAGLKWLPTIKSLRQLLWMKTRITNAGAEEFERLRPDVCHGFYM